MGTSAYFRSSGSILTWLCFAMLCSSATTKTDGTLIYKTGAQMFTVPLKYVYYVSGPDLSDAKKVIRRLLFTSKPLDTKIGSCESMRCVDPEMEGIQVDLDGAPRLLYWLALNGGRVQYSGTAKMEQISLKTDTSEKLVGELHIDDSLSGGAKLDVVFDVTKSKIFTKTE